MNTKPNKGHAARSAGITTALLLAGMLAAPASTGTVTTAGTGPVGVGIDVSTSTSNPGYGEAYAVCDALYFNCAGAAAAVTHAEASGSGCIATLLCGDFTVSVDAGGAAMGATATVVATAHESGFAEVTTHYAEQEDCWWDWTPPFYHCQTNTQAATTEHKECNENQVVSVGAQMEPVLVGSRDGLYVAAQPAPLLSHHLCARTVTAIAAALCFDAKAQAEARDEISDVATPTASATSCDTEAAAAQVNALAGANNPVVPVAPDRTHVVPRSYLPPHVAEALHATLAAQMRATLSDSMAAWPADPATVAMKASFLGASDQAFATAPDYTVLVTFT